MICLYLLFDILKIKLIIHKVIDVVYLTIIASHNYRTIWLVKEAQWVKHQVLPECPLQLPAGLLHLERSREICLGGKNNQWSFV